MSTFHIARAIESVLLAFLTQIASEAILKLKPSDRNLGNYIRLLNENGGIQKYVLLLINLRICIEIH